MKKPTRLDKKIKELLTDFAETFASLDDYGEWWGHDTDLGACEEEFELAAKDIKKLIRSRKTSPTETK